MLVTIKNNRGSGLRKLTLAVDKLPLTMPSLVTVLKNLPDSGRDLASLAQGLFTAEVEERRKDPGYEVV